MTERNSDLAALHKQLIALVDTLAATESATTDVPTIVALLREITEVNHRLVLIGQLLFHEQTAKITAAVAAVDSGRTALDKAIAEIDKLNAFINAISKFLGLVDKVVDIAKLL